MDDLLLSVVKNRNWNDLDCYAISANRSGFKGRKVMLVEDVPGEAQEALKQYGFEVYPISTYMGSLHFQSARFFAAAEFLANNPRAFRNVIWTDACDVVFQEDPIPALARALGTFQLVAVKEGWLIKNQAINDVWIKRLGIADVEYRSMREEEVLCSGTIAGTFNGMLFLFKEMKAFFTRRPDEMQGIDQGVFNYLIRQTPFKSITRIAEPEDAFATTLGIFLAASDESKWTITPPALYWTGADRGSVYTPGGRRRYVIMHQYNRAYGSLDPTGSWRAAVEGRYRDASI